MNPSDDTLKYYSGVISTYNASVGFGYIEPEDEEIKGERLLVNHQGLRDRLWTPRPHDRVLFRMDRFPRGLLATDVHLEDEATPSDNAEPDSSISGEIERTVYERGFGFIRGHDGSHPWFHVSDLPDPTGYPRVGTRVIYRMIETSKGLVAKDIVIDPDIEPREKSQLGNVGPRRRFVSQDYLARAFLATSEKRYDDAAKLFEKGLVETPTTALVMSYAAFQKNRNRRYDAMKILLRGIERFPNSAKLHEDAGVLAAMIGNHGQAVQLLLRSLELCRTTNQGGEKGVLLSLARTYYRRGDRTALAKAISYYEEALEIGQSAWTLPNADNTQLNIARVRVQHNRGELAYQFFTKLGMKIVRGRLFDKITEGADLVLHVSTEELRESYGITDYLLVCCMFKSSVSLADLKEIDLRVAELARLDTTDERVVLLIVSSLPQDLQRLLSKRIENRKEQEPAIIPITQSVMETTDVPLGALREILDRWLYRRDLFDLNSPVDGKRFFGRDKPLALLRDSISAGMSTGIFGQRKSLDAPQNQVT